MDADEWLDTILLSLDVAFEHGSISHFKYSEAKEKVLEVFEIIREAE